jgi:hypothetical protein
VFTYSFGRPKGEALGKIVGDWLIFRLRKHVPVPLSSRQSFMNYFTHALNHLSDPYFMAGTAIPDWLSVVDRKVRFRPRQLEPWLGHDEADLARIAAGTLQHLNDDDWFHSTRGFTEVTSELTYRFRAALGADEQYHCGFLGHVGMELLLDGILMEMYPDKFEEYWRILDSVDAARIQNAVNRMARFPATRLAWFIDLFRREQFLRCYANDHALLSRLNQVLVRVKLCPVPAETVTVIAEGRSYVRGRLPDLLPPQHFSLP